mmetsp:Transcript_24026/g.71506  ORF Transcript_24026/g.71506 Transcript_24026/m.71506 type:complete len:206 (-) Transcript_24026:226-843(-)
MGNVEGTLGAKDSLDVPMNGWQQPTKSHKGNQKAGRSVLENILGDASTCCCNVRPDNCALIDFMNDTVVEVYNCHNEDPWLSDPSVLGSSLRTFFKVFLDRRNGQKLGLDVDPDPGHTSLLITGVNQGGLVQQWNVQNPTKALKIGDRLIWVNGISGDPEKLVGECRKSTLLDITAETMDDPIARPTCARNAPCLLPCTGLGKVS